MSTGDLLRKVCVAILALFASALATLAPAQTAARPAPSRDKQVHLKHILVIGQVKGFEHDSVSDGMVAIYNMGRDSGLWDAVLRTDVELITKKDLGRNAKNLSY